MLQVSTELPTLEKILDTFHNYSICIKVNNFLVACHVKDL
uniref:Uncharacterized protein n=1 Tax=Arundo donax TaxID=35708 RepID=A0A0A9R3H8_ARUDO